MIDKKKSLLPVVMIGLLLSACADGSNSKGTSGGDPELKSSDGSSEIIIAPFGPLTVGICLVALEGVNMDGHLSRLDLGHPVFVSVTPHGGVLSTEGTPLERRPIYGVQEIRMIAAPQCESTAHELSVDRFSVFVSRDESHHVSSNTEELKIRFVREVDAPLGKGQVMLNPGPFYQGLRDAQGGRGIDRVFNSLNGTFNVNLI